MSLHVTLETGIIRKNIEADIANEHFHSFMNFPMWCQINRCGEGLSANLTNEWLSFIMIATMN